MLKLTSLSLLLLPILLWGCFSFDEYCEHGGLPNRQEVQYYPNKKVRMEGTIKNCYWDGEIKYYYESGKLEHIENYQNGVRRGLFEYYNPDGSSYQTENYRDSLIAFRLFDNTDSSVYSLLNKELSFQSQFVNRTARFDRPTTLFGGHEPFIYTDKGLLHLNGRYDYYVIDRKLNILFSLRDTLSKYVPTAFDETTDNSGNKHTFYWQGNKFQGDTMKVEVRYEFDKTGNYTKEWNGSFTLQ